MNKPDKDLPRKAYLFIIKHIAETGRPPTFREIGVAISVDSTGHLNHILACLVKLGLIQRQPGIARGITLTRPTGIPILGTIAAGEPLAIPDPTSFAPTVFLPIQQVLPAPEVFALLVRGQSMIEEGIHDGDHVIIRRQSTGDNGDIIVATHIRGHPDNAATLKRFYLEQNEIRLQPANPHFQPIKISSKVWQAEWQIQGKVLAIYRQY